MNDEREIILHHIERDADADNKARKVDAGAWIVESYDNRTTRAMLDVGAQQLPSRIDGALFAVDAKQLIEFIAASSHLHVEFRKHKKRFLSDATKAALAERLRAMRPAQVVPKEMV